MDPDPDPGGKKTRGSGFKSASLLSGAARTEFFPFPTSLSGLGTTCSADISMSEERVEGERSALHHLLQAANRMMSGPSSRLPISMLAMGANLEALDLNKNKDDLYDVDQCWGSGIFIPDPIFSIPDPGSRVDKIPDPHQRI
jgi:hypothetical protein